METETYLKNILPVALGCKSVEVEWDDDAEGYFVDRTFLICPYECREEREVIGGKRMFNVIKYKIYGYFYTHGYNEPDETGEVLISNGVTLIDVPLKIGTYVLKQKLNDAEEYLGAMEAEMEDSYF